jgi:NADPH:quinone reductase-like Zn-dependent oxidoreductase
MRRIRHYEYGDPSVLVLEEAPPPIPAPGELLIRTTAIGVTLPAVRRVRAGTPSALPAPIGGEVAGEIIEIAPPAADAAASPAPHQFAVGDRVTGLSFTGSYAEVVTVPATLATPIPAWACDTLAVALIRSGHVALGVLATAAPRPGESILITGAASGVGHLLVQLAKLHGVPRVIAAAGSPTKAPFLRSLGADEVITYDAESWGAPADMVLDAVGGDLLPQALSSVSPGGRLIFFNSGGGTIPAHTLLAGAKTITGFTAAHFAATNPDLYAQHTADLWHLARTFQLRPTIHAELPLTEAATAHRMIESRTNQGKVILRA